MLARREQDSEVSHPERGTENKMLRCFWLIYVGSQITVNVRKLLKVSGSPSGIRTYPLSVNSKMKGC